MKPNLNPEDPLPALAGLRFCKEHGWNDSCTELTCPTMMLLALTTHNVRMAKYMAGVIEDLRALGIEL